MTGQFVIMVRSSVDGIVEGIRELARATRDPRLCRAAAMLDQPLGGRPAIDDRRLIEEARWLVETGQAKTLNQACRKVARTVVDGRGVRSTAERLRRKIVARQKKQSTKRF